MKTETGESVTGCKMEGSDSRKRPLDSDADVGASKRSNQGAGTEHMPSSDANLLAVSMTDQVHLKILVPSIAAGAIIGKGGETITHIQKESGANIKMSKANDYYPGTTERVCLVVGSLDSVKHVHEFIMERIREKPDPNPKPVDGDIKANLERHKQIKILVPNTTAGMVIGKGGNFIRQIKEESGAYVQISQKSKDTNLPERCITIAGEPDQNQHAMDMILQKVMEDSQSASCPMISYADVKGPVASSNPTGSPFANQPGGAAAGGRMDQPNMMGQGQGMYGMNNSMHNLNLNSGGNTGLSNPALENLKATLQGSGYTEQATEEISHAIYTLASYGFLGLLGLGGLGGLGNQGYGGNPGQGQLTLANLAGILGGAGRGGGGGGGGAGGGGAGGGGGGGGNAHNGAGLLGATGTNGAGDGNPSVFGPVGSTTTTMAGGDTGEGSSSYFATASSLGGGETMFNNYNSGAGYSGATYGGTNQNSFGLGTSMGTFPTATTTTAQAGEDSGAGGKTEMEVGEYIVGAILGPGGRGIVELQRFTGANIQISKKGVYSPGTRNRIVCITGNQNAIQRAKYLIQQRISQEETKRARGGPNANNGPP